MIIKLIGTGKEHDFKCSLLIHKDGTIYATEEKRGELKKLFQKIIMTDDFIIEETGVYRIDYSKPL